MTDEKTCDNCRFGDGGSLFCGRCKDGNMWEPNPDYEEEQMPEPKLEQTGTVIQLNIGDESCMSVANAICKYERELIADIETTLIFLDELSEHIDAYIRAERRWLEYRKSKEE